MRILKVRERNVDFNGNGPVNSFQVMGQRFRKNGYSHIQMTNTVFSAHVMSGIVWINNRTTTGELIK